MGFKIYFNLNKCAKYCSASRQIQQHRIDIIKVALLVRKMNHSHLSPDVEFRYCISWFREFSEYEKSDFMDILIQWLLKPNELQVNGMTDSITKPTIFYCRVSSIYILYPVVNFNWFSCTLLYLQMKLFKEWSLKWPDQLRGRLIDKINELDSDFGQKLNENLESRLEQETTTTTHNHEDAQGTEVAVDIIHNGIAELTVTEE